MMCEFHTQDWDRIIHRVDASACRAIMLRRGCGGLKHITVKTLWVQEAVRDYSITIESLTGDACAYSCLTELNGFRSMELEDAHGNRDNAEDLESKALAPWDLVKYGLWWSGSY